MAVDPPQSPLVLTLTTFCAVAITFGQAYGSASADVEVGFQRLTAATERSFAAVSGSVLFREKIARKLEALRSRDPLQEALYFASKGDFRPIGLIRPNLMPRSSLEGIHCHQNFSNFRAAVGWETDAISKEVLKFVEEARVFVETYNRKILDEGTRAGVDVCAAALNK